MDAVELINANKGKWNHKTLVYVDPPYFEKGRYLYHDAYEPDDHIQIANAINEMDGVSWIVSYDDVRPIHDLYESSSWLQYTLSYSARNRVRGHEAMFFSDNLTVPDVPAPLREINRGTMRSKDKSVPASKRTYASNENI